MTEAITSNVERFATTPELIISDNDIERACRRKSSQVADILGTNYLPGRVVEDIQSSPDFTEWCKTHPEVTDRKNRKIYGFREVVYNNPRTRGFIEQVRHSHQVLSLLGNRRADAHFVRIASAETQPTVERFMLGYLNYLNHLASFPDKDKENRLYERIPASIDGNAGLQFWSISPYIYDSLRESGFSNTRAVEAILDWSGAREIKPGKTEDAYYPGVKKAAKDHPNFTRALYLTKDEDRPVHQFVRRIGEHIGQHIVDTYPIDDSEPSYELPDDSSRVLLSEKDSETLRRKATAEYPNRQRLDVDGVRLTFFTDDAHLGFEMKLIEREDDRVMLTPNDYDLERGGEQILAFLSEHNIDDLEVA